MGVINPWTSRDTPRQEQPGKCRRCGDPQPRGQFPAECVWCPGKPDSTGIAHCQGCGSTTHKPCLRCWDCVQREPRVTCESPVHSGNRTVLQRHAGQYCWRTKGHGEYRECRMCVACATRMGAMTADEARVAKVPDIASIPLTLETPAPPSRRIFRPTQSAHGVGSYIVGRVTGFDALKLKRGDRYQAARIDTPAYLGIPGVLWHVTYRDVVSALTVADPREWCSVIVAGAESCAPVRLVFHTLRHRDMDGALENVMNAGCMMTARAWCVL